MLNNCCIIFAIIVAQVSSAAATNCPDAGVVVVASVFATLAVVFIVLGIIGILLWKRRRGGLFISLFSLSLSDVTSITTNCSFNALKLFCLYTFHTSIVYVK